MSFPGKGAHLVLNESVLGFIRDALVEIEGYYSDGAHDADPQAVLNGLLSLNETTDRTDTFRWQEEDDNFGHKVFAVRPYKKGELRITVVLTKRQELKLDIREWFESDQ
jgi:hypothetical protein